MFNLLVSAKGPALSVDPHRAGATDNFLCCWDDGHRGGMQMIFGQITVYSKDGNE